MATMASPMREIISGIPADLLKAFQAERVYIHNLSEETVGLNLGYPTPVVHGKAVGERYSTTPVGGAETQRDMGDNKIVKDYVRAADVGKDMVRMLNENVGTNATESCAGFFMTTAAQPTEAELEKQEQRLREFSSVLIGAADAAWEQTHDMRFISGLMLRAARYMNVDRPWRAKVIQMQACPGCGTNLMPGVAVCKTCGAILDRDKAEALGIIPPPVPAEVSEAPQTRAGRK